jgi:hypothetical protein
MWTSIADIPSPLSEVLEEFGIEGDSICFLEEKLEIELESFEEAADFRDSVLALEEFDCILRDGFNQNNQIVVEITQPK